MTTIQSKLAKDLPNDLIDELLKGYQKPEDLIGENGLLKQLTKKLVERAYKPKWPSILVMTNMTRWWMPLATPAMIKAVKPSKVNLANCPSKSRVTVRAVSSHSLFPSTKPAGQALTIKSSTLCPWHDGARDTAAPWWNVGTEISRTLISSVTDAVVEEVKQRQSRPLDSVYPVVYLDCIHVKVRDAGAVCAKAVYLSIGINMNGEKEVLGLWIAQSEGAKFWLQVVTELKNLGVADIFIACVDGLKGFPEAIETVYPQAAVQLCIVHMALNSLNYVG